ncbi:MAG: hypothetical protein ACXIVQ_07835 [Acidimicrobiales bacterium]
MTRALRPLVALLVLLAALVPAVDGAAQPTQDEVTITIVDQTLWVDPDGTIEIDFVVEGAPDDADVVVTVHERAPTQQAFDRTVSREQLAGRLLGPDSLGTIDELGNGETITARIPIRSGPPEPDEPERLGILTGAGVHPVDIAVVAPDQTRLAQTLTHVVRLPIDDDAIPSDVVVVVPLAAPPSIDPDGSTSIDPELRPSLRVIATTLLDHDDVAVTMSITPELLLALDGDDQALDTLLLEDLATIADNGSLTESTFVDIDVDAMTRAGLTDEAVGLLDRGRLVTAATLGRFPDAGWWHHSAELTPAALDTLAAMGMTRLIVDAPGTTTDGAVSVATSDGPTLTALVADPDLAAHQGSTGDPRLDATRVLADLAVRHLEDPDEPLVLTLVVDPSNPRFVDSLLEGIASSPLLAARTADDALDSLDVEPITVTVPPGQSELDLAAHARALDTVRAEIRSYRSVFRDATDVEADLELRLAVTSSRELTPEVRARHMAAIPRELADELGAIDLPGRRAVTLPARDGTVPITLSNATSEEATVAVLLASEKLDFPDGERIELTIPEGVTNVDVDVRVRSSGAFPLIISVESPDGGIELAQVRYTVRSTAVSGLGVGLSVVAVVMLVVWWVRTARKARAAGRTETLAS